MSLLPEKPKILTLVLASGLAGCLLLVNLDAATNAPPGGLGTTTVCDHGWPLVFLHRESAEFDLNRGGAGEQLYRWPLPAVEGEVRIMSWMNLITNVIVCFAIVGVTVMISHSLARQVDKSLNKETV